MSKATCYDMLRTVVITRTGAGFENILFLTEYYSDAQGGGGNRWLI